MWMYADGRECDYPNYDGWLNTGNWLGYIFLETGGWAYCLNLDTWIWLSDCDADSVGDNWVWIQRGS